MWQPKTTKAEIIAAHDGVKEAIWLSRLFELRDVPIIQVDKSDTVILDQNPEFRRRTRYISIKSFLLDKKKRREILEFNKSTED